MIITTIIIRRAIMYIEIIIHRYYIRNVNHYLHSTPPCKYKKIIIVSKIELPFFSLLNFSFSVIFLLYLIFLSFPSFPFFLFVLQKKKFVIGNRKGWIVMIERGMAKEEGRERKGEISKREYRRCMYSFLFY